MMYLMSSRFVRGSRTAFNSLATLIVLTSCAGAKPAPQTPAKLATQSAMLRAEFIYETAPFPSCHASTIEATKGGLVAAWFGGTAEKNPDVGIWVARREKDRWTTPEEVATGVGFEPDRLPCWNPVLFQPTEGPLLLFYKIGPSPSTWWGMLMTSDDGGKTWSSPRRLPDGILGPIKNKPVQPANGDLLCPSSSEAAGWRIHFERTSDLGKTWSVITPAPGADGANPIDAIQPSILFHGKNVLQALGRTRSKRIFETWSYDDGKTWSPVALTTLPNPNSGTDAVTLRDGRQLLVCNPVVKGRSPLILAESLDGKNWRAVLVLEDEPGAEFSYPAVIQARDGLVHITYTWKRERIKHVVVDPNKLSPCDFTNSDWPQP